MGIRGPWAIVLHSGSEDSRFQLHSVLVGAHGKNLLRSSQKSLARFGSIWLDYLKIQLKKHREEQNVI